eukprot:gnl/TRDRNA2_/TRDRNA2_174435_c0_seq1.p1 gnl/TRDRNA2_/TRDRNA2_174435_c0~~gnl/TRDRNA2_/TRDRNA2_174435_c0_seq1.p1  ORF type:complete len:421 (+),score=64.14 gnl/TRDRNA2_/TRDRNA2_174435_c0_seq1:2-1264(+)
MMRGLAGAMNAFFWGCMLAVVVLTIWSILAVTVIHPLNVEIALTGAYDDCDRCPRAFESVYSALLTFTQQIIAGDSWGRVTIPIVEYYPWTGVFFMAVFVSLQLAILNLILAVIVDCAQEARKGSLHDVAVAKQKEYDSAKARLFEICRSMDGDKSGTLSLTELIKGLEKNQEFADMLKVLDIRKEDMPIVFGIMDQDGSGDVDYGEFVEELYKMKSKDHTTMLVFIRFYVNDVRQKLTEQIQLLRRDVKTQIDDITSSMAMESIIEAGATQSSNGCLRAAAVSGGPVEGKDLTSLQTCVMQLEGLRADILCKLDDAAQKSEAQLAALASINESLPTLLGSKCETTSLDHKLGIFRQDEKIQQHARRADKTSLRRDELPVELPSAWSLQMRSCYCADELPAIKIERARKEAEPDELVRPV